MAAEDFAIGSADLIVDNVNVGLMTEDGLSVESNPDVHEHMSSKYLGAIKASLIGREVVITVTLGEYNRDNVELALPGAVDSGGILGVGGVTGTEITPHELLVVPTDGSMTYRFHKAVLVEAGPINFNKEERGLELTFHALADLSQPDDSNQFEVS